MLLWQNLYHVNIAIGTIFLLVDIEAAVRFRLQTQDGVRLSFSASRWRVDF